MGLIKQVEDMESELIMAAATTMINSLVEEVFVPMFKKYQKSAKITSAEFLNRNKGYFNEYLLRTYNRYSIINTLVFHNSQRLLKEIYVAQTLVKENPAEYYKETAEVDRLPVSLIKKYKKILITDTAGMGKSTMMKRMFIDLIDNCIKDVGVPIYIELNRLNKDRTILKEIQEELNSLSEEFDNDLLLSFIQKGGFIFFLDGYDEISIADRDKVTLDIKDFIARASTGNFFIMTSRPESNLSSFGDFQSFTIEPLTKDEAFELLSKYDLSKKRELSTKLIKLLKSGQYRSIDEYLVNPLLVSLLFTAYDYNGSIPFEKHRFYGVVFEAYFEKQDLSKPIKSRDKLSGLNYDGFDRILRYLGFDCLVRTGVKFNEDKILNSIREAKEYCGYLENKDFSETDFLKDLTSSVPLFYKEGTDYKWVHKSLLEYFAARFIFCDAKENQDRILKAIYDSEHIDKYINMLDLYYDIDLKGFSKNITLPFCERFIQIYDAQINKVDLNKELISARISNLLFCKSALFVSSKREQNQFEYVNRIFVDTDSELHANPHACNIQNVVREKMYLALGYSSKEYLLANLLFRKNSSIVIDFSYGSFDDIKKFKEYMRVTRNGLPKEISEFEHDKVYFIDIKTGSQSKQLYRAIDIQLSWIFQRRINYDACKKEAERIKKEIDRSKATDLTHGI